MTDDVHSWQKAVLELSERPAAWEAQVRNLRGQWQLLCVREAAAADAALAQLWQNATPTVRATLLAPLCEDNPLGARSLSALVDSVAQGDVRSANAALRLLGEGTDLSAEQWRSVGRVARSQRSQGLPDIDVAVMLARSGPREAFATVALTAFRPGPEDADDRLVALGQLGRFGDLRAAGWLAGIAASGSAHLEVIQAAAALLESHPAAAVDLLSRVAAADQGLDALARWTALDGLCHAQGAEALSAVLAGWLAGGADLPAGYLDALRNRAVSLEPSLAKGGTDALRQAARGLKVAAFPPLQGLAGRVLSRDARVARQAAVEAGPAHPAVQQRAGVEAALVARGQLLGSLLPGAPPVEPGPGFAPNHARMSSADRKALVAEEARWLGD